MSRASFTLVGIVGFSPILDCYPLGPLLMRDLEAYLVGYPSVRVENMTWGPLHVVQRFQDPAEPRPDRLVVIGQAPISERPGRVSAYRWDGGNLPEAAIQARIYEAVTGIVDLDNTLIIGAHFGIWPDQCFTVEADLPVNCFGRMVIAENEARAADDTLALEFGFSSATMRQEIVSIATALAIDGARVPFALAPKRARPLPPGTGFVRIRLSTLADRPHHQEAE